MKRRLRWLAVFGFAFVGLRGAEPTGSTTFDVMIFPSTQYAHAEIFFKTPLGLAPSLFIADEIAPGQQLDLLVIARGYALGQDRKARVTYELAIHYPGGKIQRSAPAVVGSEQAIADPRMLLFPRDITRFTTEPGDPAGEYRFEVTARDQEGGGTVTKTVNVRVAASADSLPLPAGVDALNFFTDYYQHPRPRLALPVLTAFSQTSFAERKADGHGTLLGFYEQLFTDNPWLVTQFVQRLSATNEASERRILALVLAYAKRDDAKFDAALSRTARAALASARKEVFPLPSREPTTGGALDLQWGAFLASGRFEPIATLVGVVQNYLPYRGKLEEFKALPVKPKAFPLDVLKDVLLGSALWSLGSNAYQQKLVHNYLVGIEQASDTPPEVKAALREALTWRPKEAPAKPAAPAAR